MLRDLEIFESLDNCPEPETKENVKIYKIDTLKEKNIIVIPQSRYG